MIQRQCNLSKTNSFFLFGPRGSGKSTWLKHLYNEKNTLYLDLLDLQLIDELRLDPQRFLRIINAPENLKKNVIVDEIQKFPQILDVIHQQIQKTKRQFIMTGSSARKLKQAGSNLLAGRAWLYHLYPFTSFELGEKFNLKKALEVGTLPEAYLNKNSLDQKEYLMSYAATYLEKEIQQEQWVRKLEPFRRFLQVAAQMNGKILNYTKIASEVGVHDVTVANYFQILEDTLLGVQVPSFHKSVRKAQRMAPKFYFIDTGIKRALDRTLSVELLPQTSAWGDAFEHWIILEIVKLISYHRLEWSISYLRTKDDVEIDLIIDRPGMPRALIEIKSTDKVKSQDAHSLETLGRDIDSKAQRYLFSRDPLQATFGQTKAYPWEEGLRVLFGISTN